MIAPPMQDLGFSASAWTRMVVGVAFCGAAVALVWVIERPHAGLQEAPPAVSSTSAMQALPLVIESTYPVASWSVSVLNHEQPAAQSEAFAWRGSVAAVVDDEILISATAKADDQTPNHSLRITIGDAAPRLVWGGGDVTATVVVPVVTGAAAK